MYEMNNIRKYIRTILESKVLVSENIQAADKLYFTKGKLSPKVRETILRITGGDALTRILTDIYYAEIQQHHKQGQWALSAIDDDEEESVPDAEGHHHMENDVMKKEDWLLLRDTYNQLKAYNKNVFPIKGYSPNGVVDIWNLIGAIKQRAQILEKIKALPSVAIRNMREDIRRERNYSEMQDYRSRLEYFLGHYSLLGNRDDKMKKVIDKKMFRANITLDNLISFAEEKENMLGGAKITKRMVKKMVEEDPYDLNIVYEKGNVMVVDVTGAEGIKTIGCNSVWCFTYTGKSVYGNWRDFERYSTNGHVYAIIDFSKPSDSPYFMYVLIKPLKDKYTEEDENNEQMPLFNMANEPDGYPIETIHSLMSTDDAYHILNFGEHRPGPSSRFPYENPNQMKLDLKEIRRIIREVIEDKIDYPYEKVEKLVDYFKEEYQDYMNKQGWDIFVSDSEVPLEKYKSKNYLFFQIEKIDEPYGEAGFYEEPGNALIGISSDVEAIELARKLKLMVDDYGVVYGYDGVSFLDKSPMNETKKSKFEKLQDNKVPLTPEEREKVMKAKAVWHHGPNGEETPAVWKSKDKKTGKFTYVTNTHRAYQDRPTLKGAISIYHKFIKSTA